MSCHSHISQHAQLPQDILHRHTLFQASHSSGKSKAAARATRAVIKMTVFISFPSRTVKNSRSDCMRTNLHQLAHFYVKLIIHSHSQVILIWHASFGGCLALKCTVLTSLFPHTHVQLACFVKQSPHVEICSVYKPLPPTHTCAAHVYGGRDEATTRRSMPNESHLTMNNQFYINWCIFVRVKSVLCSLLHILMLPPFLLLSCYAALFSCMQIL